MSKLAVVYWTGTGNTEEMANAVAEGAKEKSAEVTLFSASDFNAGMIDSFDAIAFGCPAMGDEALEEEEFEPMFEGCKNKLKGKKIGLFGSYGWGDGEWIREWKKVCASRGAVMPREFVICNGAPDEEGVKECKALGAALA